MSIEEKILELVMQANPANPTQYVHDIVKEYSIDKLNSHITSCDDCEICKNIKTVTYGNSNASILIIGDTVLEEQIGKNPYVYPFENSESGNILNTVFDMLNVDKEKLFYINAVSCWPNKKIDNKLIKRTPNKKEVSNCFSFVEFAIKVVEPRVILLLGSIASNLFFKESISKIRGQWITANGYQAMPTYHPGYFIELEGKKDEDFINMAKCEFLEDIRKCVQYVTENYPEDIILIASDKS